MRRCKVKRETEKRGKSKRGKRQRKGEKELWICSLKKKIVVTLRRKKLCPYKQKSSPDSLPGLCP